jgi:hypothetical protein
VTNVAPPNQAFRSGDFTVDLVRQVGPEREQAEKELVESGVALPLPHRCAWARVFAEPESWFLSARGATGTCRAGVAVEAARSRTLPGHWLLRVRRCGPMKAAGALEAALAGLADLARRDSRVLRVAVEVFSPDPPFRAAVAGSLAGCGFRRVPTPRGYTHTIAVDLTPDEAGILASFQSSARRNVKSIAKQPLAVRPITDRDVVPRMADLMTETVSRTGGVARPTDWPGRIELSRQYPSLSRLVGLFRTDATGPEALLAFAWGCHHGDHVEYEAGASTRETGTRVPLAYALIWDLIRWAKQTGASWFDMGGVTPGQLGDTDDPLGGISDFKRFFSKTVVEVGDEWEYEPHPVRAGLARAAGRIADWFSGARRT